MPKRFTDDRAVSDVVAFTLTFGIIVTSIGLVSFGAVGALEQVQGDARSSAAEVAMNGFAIGMDDHVEDGAPRRIVEFGLSGDSVFRHESYVNVSVELSDGSHVNRTVDAGAFERRTAENASIVYASGALFRIQNGGQVILDTPAIRCGEDSAHVSIAQLNGTVAASSDGSVQIETSIDRRQVVYPDVTEASNLDVAEVTVNVTETRYRQAWEETMESELPGWQGSDGRYTCSSIDRAVVRVTSVDLDVIT